MLTEVVDDIGLRPLRPIRSRRASSLRHCSIQEKVVDLVLAEFVQGLLCKAFHALEIGKVERQQRHAVLGIVIESVIGCLGRLGVSDAEDEFVGLRLLQQLLDCLEALTSASAE